MCGYERRKRDCHHSWEGKHATPQTNDSALNEPAEHRDGGGGVRWRSGSSNPPASASTFPHTLPLGTALGAKRLFKQVGMSGGPFGAGRAGLLQRPETPA